ncbi:Nitroreductase [Amniculicola lignicola CBS 123094]|uniref:Nitroreductase n=1 Tax=Amniculicola lignicola CBS 123094 TaxID=1392246 RepID=A0A6A5WQK0_9PLEO|nr:Nitroreductase [Amniculicola lignicola CBS 123094]
MSDTTTKPSSQSHAEITALPTRHPSLCPPCSDPRYISNSVTKLICQRHSVRAFLPKPIDPQIFEEVLCLSRRRWWNRSGVEKRRVRHLYPKPIDIIEVKWGMLLYGSEGYNVDRNDKKALEHARLRNYEFFDVPVGTIISMHSSLAPVDTMILGMYLQTLCLLLAERGLGTCIAVSVVGYSEVLRKGLGLGGNMVPLTGLVIGWEDEKEHVNWLRIKRDARRECVSFVDE